MNQLGLTLAIQAASFGTFAREASGKRHLQVLLDKPLLDADHRTATDGESLGNLPISVTGFSLTLIAHQQDSRYQVVLGRGSAGMYHRFQPLSLLLAQSYWVAVVRRSHAFPPSIGLCVWRLRFAFVVAGWPARR